MNEEIHFVISRNLGGVIMACSNGTPEFAISTAKYYRSLPHMGRAKVYTDYDSYLKALEE